MDKNPGIILQARLTSSRFANKNLCPIMNEPIIDWVIKACKKTTFPLAIAIPDEKSNYGLAEYIKLKYGKDIPVFVGHPQDLISRFIKTNTQMNFDPIIRICSDNPFLAPEDIELAIKLYNSRGYYSRVNHVEVFGVDEMEWADKHDVQIKRREDCVNILAHCVDYPTDIELFEMAWHDPSPTMKGIKRLWGLEK